MRAQPGPGAAVRSFHANVQLHRFAPLAQRPWFTRSGRRVALLVARAVHQPVRQVTPEYGIEHPKVYPHARVGWIGRGPVRRTAAGWAVPKIERAIALLIRDARIHHGHGIGGAIMPEPGSAPAYRAVTLGGLDRHVAQDELNSPAMAAPVVLAHPRGLLAIVKLGQRIVARDPNARKSSPHFLTPLRGSRVHRRGDPPPDIRGPSTDLQLRTLINVRGVGRVVGTSPLNGTADFSKRKFSTSQRQRSPGRHRRWCATARGLPPQPQSHPPTSKVLSSIDPWHGFDPTAGPGAGSA